MHNQDRDDCWTQFQPHHALPAPHQWWLEQQLPGGQSWDEWQLPSLYPPISKDDRIWATRCWIVTWPCFRHHHFPPHHLCGVQQPVVGQSEFLVQRPLCWPPMSSDDRTSTTTSSPVTSSVSPVSSSVASTSSPVTCSCFWHQYFPAHQWNLEQQPVVGQLELLVHFPLCWPPMSSDDRTFEIALTEGIWDWGWLLACTRVTQTPRSMRR